jgi:hypothetical protein
MTGLVPDNEFCVCAKRRGEHSDQPGFDEEMELLLEEQGAGSWIRATCLGGAKPLRMPFDRARRACEGIMGRNPEIEAWPIALNDSLSEATAQLVQQAQDAVVLLRSVVDHETDEAARERILDAISSLSYAADAAHLARFVNGPEV